MINSQINSFKWINNVHKILNDVGRPDLWINQHLIQSKNLKNLIKRILKDQQYQTWSASMQNSTKGK